MTDQPLVATCSWTGFRREMGIPVRISIGAPRWIKLPDPRYTDYQYWPRIIGLTPDKSYFNEPDDAKWSAAFFAQLNQNAARIAAELGWINENCGGRAVLLCFEKQLLTPNTCHRTMAARWMRERFGWDVPELGNGR